MRKSLLSTMGVCSLLLSYSIVSGEVDPDAMAKGKAVFEKTCQLCHQATGLGIPNAFPPLAESDWVKGSKERSIKIVLKGLAGPITVNGNAFTSMMIQPGTPPGSLTDADIANVLTFVRNSFGNSESAVSEAEVAAVREKIKDRTAPWTADELLKDHPLEK